MEFGLIPRDTRAQLEYVFTYCRTQQGDEWHVDFSDEKKAIDRLVALVTVASPPELKTLDLHKTITDEWVATAATMIKRWQKKYDVHLGQSVFLQLSLAIARLLMP